MWNQALLLAPVVAMSTWVGTPTMVTKTVIVVSLMAIGGRYSYVASYIAAAWVLQVSDDVLGARQWR